MTKCVCVCVGEKKREKNRMSKKEDKWIMCAQMHKNKKVPLYLLFNCEADPDEV